MTATSWSLLCPKARCAALTLYRKVIECADVSTCCALKLHAKPAGCVCCMIADWWRWDASTPTGTGIQHAAEGRWQVVACGDVLLTLLLLTTRTAAG
jgi:hypothetical protein